MLPPLRRPVVAASRSTLRRFASSHNDEHVLARPERFGKAFFISMAAFIGGFAYIQYDQTSADDDGPWLTRLIKKNHSMEDVWAERSHARQKMIAQAAQDRALFHDSPQVFTVPMRYPQIFDMGSPYNNEAGWATGNLEEVRDHFLKQRENYVPKSLRKKQEEEAKEAEAAKSK